MGYVIPKEFFDTTTFEWDELKGKTLKINVSYDEESGLRAVAGKDIETGHIYILDIETKKES